MYFDTFFIVCSLRMHSQSLVSDRIFAYTTVIFLAVTPSYEAIVTGRSRTAKSVNIRFPRKDRAKNTPADIASIKM